MAVKVLVVDDSGFSAAASRKFFQRIRAFKWSALQPMVKRRLIRRWRLPDVITMDYEMPMMDGITAVRHIMQRCPTPVLMFSSLTHEGARVTLDALDAGAVDFLPKNFEDISRNPEKVKQLLCEKVHSISRSNRRFSAYSAPAPAAAPTPAPAPVPSSFSSHSTSAPARPAPAPVHAPAQAVLRPPALRRPRRNAKPTNWLPLVRRRAARLRCNVC